MSAPALNDESGSSVACHSSAARSRLLRRMSPSTSLEGSPSPKRAYGTGISPISGSITPASWSLSRFEPPPPTAASLRRVAGTGRLQNDPHGTHLPPGDRIAVHGLG